MVFFTSKGCQNVAWEVTQCCFFYLWISWSLHVLLCACMCMCMHIMCGENCSVSVTLIHRDTVWYWSSRERTDKRGPQTLDVTTEYSGSSKSLLLQHRMVLVFPNSGGTSALVGLALRGSGGRNGGNIPAWLALLPACRLVGGLSIKAEAGNKVLCVADCTEGDQRLEGTSHLPAFLRNAVEVSQTKQTGRRSQKRLRNEPCQHTRDSGEISGVWGSASCAFRAAWAAALSTYFWRTGWNWLSEHVGSTVAWKTQLCLNHFLVPALNCKDLLLSGSFVWSWESYGSSLMISMLCYPPHPLLFCFFHLHCWLPSSIFYLSRGTSGPAKCPSAGLKSFFFVLSGPVASSFTSTLHN